jgi:hypothetical protein
MLMQGKTSEWRGEEKGETGKTQGERCGDMGSVGEISAQARKKRDGDKVEAWGRQNYGIRRYNSVGEKDGDGGRRKGYSGKRQGEG